MTNQEKYDNVFISTFSVQKDQLPTLTYQGITAWDSVGHMTLAAALEEAFDIMMETDDIIEINSYRKGMEILAEKYHVEF